MRCCNFQGKVYLLDYNEEERADVLHCWDNITGEELWRRWYKVPVKRNHGMSRTISSDNRLHPFDKSVAYCVLQP